MTSEDIRTIMLMLLFVVLSAFFSATETAFSSLSRTKIKSLADKGNARAKLTLGLISGYDSLLSTVLVGNNIVNIALASVATVFFVSHWGDSGTTLSTLIVTVVVLIFGEITPKSMAKESPESFAMFSAPFIKALGVVLFPINWLFSKWKKLIARIFKVRGDRRLTDAELLTIVAEAQHDGALDEQESELIRSAIDFNDQKAVGIATPRVDIAGVSIDASNEQIIEVFRDTEFSRLPVYDGTIDNIVGIVHQKDFYNSVIRDRKPLREVINEVVFITEFMKIGSLLKLLQSKKCHMAVITDEFGGTVGIVTMEDIFGTSTTTWSRKSSPCPRAFIASRARRTRRICLSSSVSRGRLSR